jgi:hypothetical protein
MSTTIAEDSCGPYRAVGAPCIDLGGGADLDHRDSSDPLGQPFLQLLAVVIGRAGLVIAEHSTINADRAPA